MNITKLKCWQQLEKLGFEPINYRFNGKKLHTGASLRKQLKSISGEMFYTDIITIEPHNFSDRKNFHISGDVKTPFTDKFYRYEYGQKIELYRTVDHINEFFTANEILKTVNLMLA